MSTLWLPPHLGLGKLLSANVTVPANWEDKKLSNRCESSNYQEKFTANFKCIFKVELLYTRDSGASTCLVEKAEPSLVSQRAVLFITFNCSSVDYKEMPSQ